MKKENEIAASVRDDGVGVPEEIADFRPGSIGVGIGGMRQRVKKLGGDLRLRNASPGTIIKVVIPIVYTATEIQAISATVN